MFISAFFTERQSNHRQLCEIIELVPIDSIMLSNINEYIISAVFETIHD